MCNNGRARSQRNSRPTNRGGPRKERHRWAAYQRDVRISKSFRDGS